MYYYVRNRYPILVSKFCHSKPLAFFLYIGFLFAFATAIIVFQKTNKIKKLSMLIWSCKDAFTRNFIATPSSILEKLGQQHKDPVTNLRNYIRNNFGILSSGSARASVHE